MQDLPLCILPKAKDHLQSHFWTLLGAPGNPTPRPPMFFIFVSLGKMNHEAPETPNTHEVNSTGVGPLMDTECQIVDPACPFLLVDLCYEVFSR